jgi:hypothetical protein
MGVYTCTASNLAGAITTNITLNVLESPRFVKPMQDRKVRTDQNYNSTGYRYFETGHCLYRKAAARLFELAILWGGLFYVDSQNYNCVF